LLHEISAEFPFLFELATFEWALCEAIYTGTGQKADPAKLNGVPEAIWSQARLILNPSARLFNFQWPIPTLWKNSSPVPESRTFVLVHGHGEKSFFHVINENEFKVLRLFQKGAGLEPALLEAGLTDPAAINEAFARWMSWGLFADFDLSTEGCD
jgi:hypothetical protein